jgi:AbrB family looped-hinge helix DNA binding protein
VAVGERGQIVIPMEARNEYGIKQGDKLLAFGIHGKGLMFLKSDEMRQFAEKIQKIYKDNSSFLRFKYFEVDAYGCGYLYSFFV